MCFRERIDNFDSIGEDMEYAQLIANRYSVRAYRPDPVEDEKLLQVLETVTFEKRQDFMRFLPDGLEQSQKSCQR